MSVPCIELSHRRCKSHRGLHGLCAWSVAHMGCGSHGLWHTWAVASATSTWDVRGR